MINTILSQITGLFQKDFLFASFLPALILLAWVIAVLLTVFGVDYVFGAYDELTATQQATIATLATLTMIVVAYLLNALRGPFIRIWSGESPVANAVFYIVVKVGQLRQTRRFQRLRTSMKGDRVWFELLEEFSSKVRPHWSKTKAIPSKVRMSWIMSQARSLTRDDEATVRQQLDQLARWYVKYSGESLKPFFEIIKRKLTDWADKDSFALQRFAAQLDRSFGPVATIRPTSLGNVIEAYNHYGYSRYRMETEIFWPRLLKVVPEGFIPSVREPKILLDFAVTMATISVVVAAITMLVGPWLWFDVWIWSAIALVQLLAGAFFYALSVDAAVQYGDMLRACFDLFRLDLLEQLAFERPTTLKEERERWEKISQLIVYGQESDLKIAAAKAE